MVDSTAKFRGNPGLVESLKEIFKMEAFQIALEVLSNESPIKQRQEGDASRLLGRIEGYDECMSKLKRLASYTARPNIDNQEVIDVEEYASRDTR